MDNMTFTLFNTFFLAGFFSFVAVFYLVLIITKQSKLKHKVVHKGTPFSLHWCNHALFGVFRATILTVCIGRIFFPAIDTWLITFNAPQAVILMGQIGMLLGFGLAVSASVTMKQAWRSGVDNHFTPPLVTHGLYSIVRNPNYLGVQMAQLGFFLALPSVFTAVCLVIGWVCIHIQANIEQTQLNKLYGQTYRNYMQHTPRWLPTLKKHGKLNAAQHR